MVLMLVEQARPYLGPGRTGRAQRASHMGWGHPAGQGTSAEAEQEKKSLRR